MKNATISEPPLCRIQLWFRDGTLVSSGSGFLPPFDAGLALATEMSEQGIIQKPPYYLGW